jgi:branched-chain amino acid transport system ATP-binding protein
MNGMLIVKGIRKTFGNLVALEDVNMSIKKGLINVLIGPNGSGKTTLINVISGVYKPDRGKIWFNGKEITGWPPEKIYAYGIARTYQIPRVFKSLTVLENLLVASKENPGESFSKALFKRKWIKEEGEEIKKAFKILKTVELEDMFNKMPSELSGGQIRLLEIGRALMSGAKLLLMDEITAGIFPPLAREIFSHLDRLKRELKITFLIVEHRIDFVLDWADYVYAMVDGKIIDEGNPNKVINNPILLDRHLGD